MLEDVQTKAANLASNTERLKMLKVYIKSSEAQISAKENTSNNKSLLELFKYSIAVHKRDFLSFAVQLTNDSIEC